MTAPRRAFTRTGYLLAVCTLAVDLSACGGASKTSGTVFDPAGVTNASTVDTASAKLERIDSSMKVACLDEEPCTSVSVLGGAVRLARPSRWQVRDGSLESGHTFIRYVSPNGYSFAVYERSDSPGASWKEILEHYESDLTANGAKATGLHVPVATATNQGLAYTVDRKIENVAILSRSREILLRGPHHIVAVQVVTQEENLSRIASELLAILRHIEVL